MKKRHHIKDIKHDTEAREVANVPDLPGAPRVIPRGEHTISRSRIDEDALKVLYRLQRNGYQAFLVGGGVRDLLLEKTPKDFDISTNARPEEMRKLFRNSRIIGRRFKLVQVYFYGNKIIEVATFRGVDQNVDASPQMLAADNTYGDAESDAFRRDLTINALFYDAGSFSIIDYVGGLDDLRNGCVRVIGNAEIRFREDPIRIIRTVRHAARTGFAIEASAVGAIKELSNLLLQCPKARVFEELLKDFKSGSAEKTFDLFITHDLLQYLLPFLAEALREKRETTLSNLHFSLGRIDAAFKAEQELSTSILFAALLIGNIPLQFRRDPSYALVENFFNISPQHVVLEDVTGEGSARALIEHGMPGSPNFTVGGERREALSTFLQAILKDAGVYKKDKEVMEKLLIARYELVRRYADAEEPRGITSNSYFNDAVKLLALTCNDELSNCAAQFWVKKISDTMSPQSSFDRRVTSRGRQAQNTRKRRRRRR